jgi:hypothetical protein
MTKPVLLTSSMSGVLVLLAFLVPATAWASPWTLPQGDVAVKLSTDVQYANREFLLAGDNVPFSLDGQFWAGNFRSDIRYGISDRLEIGGSLSFSYVGYDADPVFFGSGTINTDYEGGTNEDIRANIVSLDQTAAGLGDLRLFMRNRWTPIGRAVFATELNVKIPTGYRQPAGTFNDDDPSQGVADDVTIGDGQMDITALALAGFSPTWNWFIRLDAGARARLFGPAPQVVGAFKTGVRITPTFLPYIFCDAQITVGEGREIGDTYITNNPELDAVDFDLDDLEIIPQRLDRSSVVPGIGAIFTFNDRDIDVNYSTVVWGRNTAQLHIFSIGTNLRFQ